MKKLLFIIPCIIALGLLLSCEKGKTGSERTITELTSDTGLYIPLHIYETSDGYTIVDSIGYGPLVEKVTFYDKEKRMIAMAGTTSECGMFTFAKVLYGDDGEILGYAFLDYVSESEDSMWRAEQTADDAMFEPYQEMLIAQALDYGDDNKIFERYYLKKDDNGNAVEVYDPKTRKSIKAPHGYNIRAEIVENEDFWASDMYGGFVLLNFYVEPIDRGIGHYTVTKYNRYDKQMCMEYKDNKIVKSTLYSKKSHKPIYSVACKTQKDAAVYEYTYPKDSNIYRSTWKGGVIYSHEAVSCYGTVLSQTLYVPSKDGEAFICYEKKYDYKSKQLVRSDEYRVGRREVLNDNKESDVMSLKEHLFENWSCCY